MKAHFVNVCDSRARSRKPTSSLDVDSPVATAMTSSSAVTFALLNRPTAAPRLLIGGAITAAPHRKHRGKFSAAMLHRGGGG